MSYRIVQYSLDDFILDVDAVESSLNDACRRDHRRYRISGICQTMNERVVFVFEEDASDADWSYVVRPFSADDSAAVLGDIRSRWQGKYSTKGLIQLNNSALGVFERAEKERTYLD